MAIPQERLRGNLFHVIMTECGFLTNQKPEFVPAQIIFGDIIAFGINEYLRVRLNVFGAVNGVMLDLCQVRVYQVPGWYRQQATSGGFLSFSVVSSVMIGDSD